LIAYSIAAARAARLVERCVVSTDDAEIAETARRYGAEVLHRPAELATDIATTASVARDVVERLDAGAADVLVTLQPTNPLRPATLLDEAIALYGQGGCDSVVSVTRTHLKTGTVAGGFFVPQYPVGARSQDLPDVYFENGLVYVCGAALPREGGDLFGRRVRPVFTDPLFAQDIDTELDFQIAESVFERHRDRFPYVSA
jgi:N-acylneuraminate cytidylyltransferase